MQGRGGCGRKVFRKEGGHQAAGTYTAEHLPVPSTHKHSNYPVIFWGGFVFSFFFPPAEMTVFLCFCSPLLRPIPLVPSSHRVACCKENSPVVSASMEGLGMGMFNMLLMFSFFSKARKDKSELFIQWSVNKSKKYIV